ncbi:hypothetical protein [Treponema berlinense]|uniref:hypothetical protein n=1 Tax=Treponema berlinense TaxID=225004 RepID=UPI003F08C71B
MLKSKFFKFSAFSIAAIALAFNFAACDSGNDEYIPEKPTTYREFNATGNGVCTAHWTFAKDKASIGASEVSLEGKEIPADEGTGATLVGANGLGIKYGVDSAGNAGLQAGRKSVVLEENPGDGPALKLTTTVQTNLTFKVAGAGAADPSRIFLITDKDGENLVWKSNLASVTSIDATTVFHLKGAPAGVYYIYFNGSKIWEINAKSSDNDVTKPNPYVEEDVNNWSISADKPTFTAITQAAQITLKDQDGNDVTNSAVWKVMSGADIAEVDGTGNVKAKTAASEGSVSVRGRIGRFYKDITLEISKNEDLLNVDSFVTTVASGNLPKADTKITDFSETGADIAKVLKTNVTGNSALVTAESATIEIGDVLKTLCLGEDLDGTKGNVKYVYNPEKKIYEKSDEVPEIPNKPDEIWRIKDPASKDGGLHVKGFPVAPTETGSVLYTLKLKVTPAAGKNLKVTGVMAALNAGKGADTMKCDVYVGENLQGTLSSTKGGIDPVPAMFETAYNLTGETEFVFKVVSNSIKDGQSVQLHDLSLLIEE